MKKSKAKRQVFTMLFFSGLFVLAILIMQPLQIIHFKEYISVLFPKGTVAFEERNLLLVIQALMLLIIIPVYIMTFIFSWIYRAGNQKATYDPDLVDHKVAEIIWWGLPFLLTIVVAVITLIKTYELDPYKPLESDKKPITIQAVALQWNWLFLYPEENVASMNFFQIPKDTPLHFEITADAPMNAFWLPDLGGMIYAMPKMKTDLYLIANEIGDFPGNSANLSGEGFAGMRFIARASSDEDYKKWLETAKKSGNTLDFASYQKLAKPSFSSPVQTFHMTENGLFNQILMKFMKPSEK